MNNGDTTATAQKVHLVIQRYRSCRVLVEEERWVDLPCVTTSSGDRDVDTTKQKHCGMLVYVSFAAGTTSIHVQQAVETLFHITVLTTGGWGDGTAPQSLQKSLLEAASREETHDNVSQLQVSSSSTPSPLSMAIIPQANLISKVKSKGKSIQYHGQIKKEEGALLFEEFVNEVQSRALEAIHTTREMPSNTTLPDWYTSWKASQASAAAKASVIDASTPPLEMFRNLELYSSWEESTGLPTLLLANNDGDATPITKSARKKLVKQQQAHAKRHEKWLSTQQEADATTTKANRINNNNEIQQPNDAQWSNALRPHIQIVAGTFGKRQGLELASDMGPFCHVFQV